MTPPDQPGSRAPTSVVDHENKLKRGRGTPDEPDCIATRKANPLYLLFKCVYLLMYELGFGVSVNGY